MIYLILAISFAFRAMPRIILRNSYVSDTFYHLYCASVIRENAFRLPLKLPRVVLNHQYTYPFLYHYLLALFPYRARVWVERLSGAFFDTATVVLVYWFALCLFQDHPAHHMAEIAAALYALSPALLRLGSGPRAYHGSPRAMGESLYVFHIVTAFFAISENAVPMWIFSIISGSALILTAKFGNQVLIIFGSFFASCFSALYAVIVAGCFALALLVGGRKTVNVLIGQLRHSHFYAKYLQRIFLIPSIREPRGYVRSLLGAAYKLVIKGKLGKFAEWYFREPFYLHVLITVYPQLGVLVCNLEMNWDLADRFLMTWVFAGCLSFFLTRGVRLLQFLGEGERYLEYALLPSIVLPLKYFGEESYLWSFVLILYFTVSAVYFQWQYFTQFRKIDSDLLESTELFRSVKSEGKRVVLPLGSHHWEALYRSNLMVLTIGGNIDEGLMPYESFAEVFGEYPYPSRDLRKILRRYAVDYILTDQESLDYYKKIMQEPELFGEAIRLSRESRMLSLYKVNRL